MSQLEISIIGGVIVALIIAISGHLYRKAKAWGKKVLEKLDMLDHIPSLELQVLGHEQRLREHGERISTLEGVAQTRDSL